MRRNKYKAVKTNGFASKLESAGYDFLKLREMAGEIKDIKCQQAVTLATGGGMSIRWKVDFSFVINKTDVLEYCELKGIETADFKLKLKLYKMNPPAPLTIMKGKYYKSGIRLFISERIEA